MEYFYSVLLEVHTSSTSVRCCHICVREFKKKKKKGIALEKTKLKYGNGNRMRAEIVKCVTKLLYGT